LIPSQKIEIQKGIKWIQTFNLKVIFFENKDILVIHHPCFSSDLLKLKYPKSTFETDHLVKIIEMKTKRTIDVKMNNPNKIKQKIDIYNQVLKGLKLPYRLDIQIYSRKPFYQKYKDRIFVSNYLNEYAEILKDEFLEKTRFYSEPNLILQKWSGFQWLMEMIKNKEIQKIYQNVSIFSKEYLELVRQIKELENQLILCS
jgi:hypothetical protein